MANHWKDVSTFDVVTHEDFVCATCARQKVEGRVFHSLTAAMRHVLVETFNTATVHEVVPRFEGHPTRSSAEDK